MKYPIICKNQIQSTLLLITVMALFVVQLTATIVGSYIICALVILFNANTVQINRRHFEFILAGIFFCFLSAASFNHQVTPLFYLAMTPLLLWVASNFSSNSLAVIRSSLRNTFWIFSIFIFSGLILHWDEPEPLGAILPWTSTNGFPSYLIVLQIAYSLSYFLEFKRLPLSSCFITLIVAAFGLGRGSMIVGVAMILSSLFLNIAILKSSKDQWWAFRIFPIFIGAIYIFYIYNAGSILSMIDLWFENSKFSNGVLDEHRGRMLIDYLEMLESPLRLFFGASYEHTSINDVYGGNPHNSYIRVHSFYGLFGLLIVFVPLISLFISRKNRIQKFVFALFIIFALLRAVSEPIFFPSTLDFFYFVYFFLFFNFAKKNY